MPTRARLALFLAAIVFAACCCGGATAQWPRRISHSAVVDTAYDSTVSLVRAHEDGTFSPFCTGSWVSRTAILTAAHCVDEAMTEAEEADAELYGFEPDLTGRIIRFRTWAQTTQYDEEPTTALTSVILGLDRKHDLALLSVGDVSLAHSVAYLADRMPMVADEGFIIGHSLGLAFSYTPAWVGAVRWMENVRGDWQTVIQTFSGANRGNSGGPLMAPDGRIWGVASFMATGSTLVFFVTCDDARTFLRAEGVIS